MHLTVRSVAVRRALQHQRARKSQPVEFKRDSQCREGWQSGIGESEQIQDRPCGLGTANSHRI